MTLREATVGGMRGRAALKTRAVQTLRALQRPQGVAERLECARFIAAFGTSCDVGQPAMIIQPTATEFLKLPWLRAMELDCGLHGWEFLSASIRVICG